MSTTTPPVDGQGGPPPPSASHTFLQRLTTGSGWKSAVVIPLLAVLTAFVIGGIIMMLAGVPFGQVLDAYRALISGSVGSVKALSETLTAATPLILTGLAVAIAFRAGLFNIGGEGQMLIGGMTALVIGFTIDGLPWFVHLPLALLGGIVGGAIWGFVPGILRAKTGAHEVITTIMMNYIAFRLVEYLLTLSFFQKEGRNDPISKSVEGSAELPQLLGWQDPALRVHLGLLVAVLAAVAIHWMLFRTNLGFEFRAVGANPAAARYAGMSVSKVYILVMSIAGGLAGLAGANQVLGVLGRASPGFTASLGFDGIAVALLGRSNPMGVVAAALLFGGLRAGGQQMQVEAGVGIDLIAVIQALIIIFVAAPTLITTMFRLKAPSTATQISRGWAS